MNFIIIIISSVLAFIPFCLFLIVTNKGVIKLMKSAEESMKFNFPVSFSFLILYIQIYFVVIKCIINENINSLEWYLIYTCIGGICVIWCYFKWESKIILPQFNVDKKQLAQKKMVVYIFVMVFSLYHGYIQIEKMLNGVEVDIILAVSNVTIIPGIIALDRVLNQISILYTISKSKN